MAKDSFDFKPAPIPQAERGRRRSKYAATIESVQKYLEQHPEQTSVKLDLGDTSLKAASASFRKAILSRARDSLKLVQRSGDLYIARR